VSNLSASKSKFVQSQDTDLKEWPRRVAEFGWPNWRFAGKRERV